VSAVVPSGWLDETELLIAPEAILFGAPRDGLVVDIDPGNVEVPGAPERRVPDNRVRNGKIWLASKQAHPAAPVRAQSDKRAPVFEVRLRQ
jgi:hypothetical protein